MTKPEHLIVEDITHALFARRRRNGVAWDELTLDVIQQYRADARVAYDIAKSAVLDSYREAAVERIASERSKYDDPTKDSNLYNRGVLFGFSVAGRIAGESA